MKREPFVYLQQINGGRRMKAAWISALMVGVVAQTLAQKPAPHAGGIAAAEASVSAENIREHDKFISDDLFEGRYPGLRGGELAAKYIATQFALYGLTPAGDNGTYLQQVNFVGMTAKPAGTSFAFTSKDGKPFIPTYAEDYTVS